MGSTTSSPGSDGDTGSVERRIVDALDDRFTRNVAVNPQEQFAAVLFGGQYNQDTAKKITREEVEPILGKEWCVDGIPAPTAEVDVDLPLTAGGLRVIPLDSQGIGDIDIYAHTVGLVSGGLDAYLETNLVGSHDIPRTYGQWDDEFPTTVVGRNDDIDVFDGPVGEACDADEALQFRFRSEYVQAAVRIITGGGRFNQDEFKFHEAVPLAILDHHTVSIAIAPLMSNHSLDDVSHPDFVYTDDGGYDFHVLD